jgi:hypothetical protein
MDTCPACDRAVNPHDAFCRACGTRITDGEPHAATVWNETDEPALYDEADQAAGYGEGHPAGRSSRASGRGPRPNAPRT